MTMARALLGMSCLLSWQSMPLLQSQHSRQQQCWANFMCVLVKKKLKIYIPMYDWFPYDCLSNCPTATPTHPPPSSFCTRLRALIDCLYAHSPSVWKENLNRIPHKKTKKKKKRIKPKITHFLRKLLLVTEGRNPLTLIASPQTHKQFIWHARTHTYAPSPFLQGGRKIEARLWVSSFLWDILLTLPEIYHVNLWEMLI